MKLYGPRVLLEQMLEAASRATSFIDGMGLEDFLGDIRTQQAVAMSLINIGEMASISNWTSTSCGTLWRSTCPSSSPK
jgi:uncharacterized protein with HEPN domain